jgi:Family of unknown function (DUF5681)
MVALRKPVQRRNFAALAARGARQDPSVRPALPRRCARSGRIEAAQLGAKLERGSKTKSLRSLERAALVSSADGRNNAAMTDPNKPPAAVADDDYNPADWPGDFPARRWHPGEHGKPGNPNWKKGVSGNPVGRPHGSRSRTTVALESLLDDEGAALTRRCIEAALGGDMFAMKLCLERIFPIRKRLGVKLELPEVNCVRDLIPAINAISDALSQDVLDIDGANALSNLLEQMRRTLETVELEARIKALEERGDVAD